MQFGKQRRLLASVLAGLALILLPAGCCHVPTLLFQSHAQTPAWVKTAPAAAAGEAFFVGRAWARDRLDEDYVLSQARAAVASSIATTLTTVAGQGAAVPAKPSRALVQAAAALTAALTPREVYWEQWQRTCALSLTSKSYLYYMLFAVPQTELERLRGMSTPRADGGGPPPPRR